MNETRDTQAPGTGAAGLAALLSRAERAGKTAPPVERWNPEHCGDIDIVIAADGSWHHAGSPIARPEMVRLFSSVLRREADGSFCLVTPVELMRITVEDAPFLAVEMERSVRADGEPVLTFRTNVGDVVEAGPDHPIRARSDDGGFVPYVLVRGRLEARLTRPAALELAELAEDDGQGGLCVRSNGAAFTLDDTPDTGR